MSKTRPVSLSRVLIVKAISAVLFFAAICFATAQQIKPLRKNLGPDYMPVPICDVLPEVCNVQEFENLRTNTSKKTFHIEVPNYGTFSAAASTDSTSLTMGTDRTGHYLVDPKAAFVEMGHVWFINPMSLEKVDKIKIVGEGQPDQDVIPICEILPICGKGSMAQNILPQHFTKLSPMTDLWNNRLNDEFSIIGKPVADVSVSEGYLAIPKNADNWKFYK